MENMHQDPVVPVLLALSMIFIGAKLGAIIAQKIGQPSVLGELTAGILMGNLVLLGLNACEFIKQDHLIEIFSSLGVIILLFEVGLESNIREMAEVGIKSLSVAVIGVISPFVLGYFVSGLLIPGLDEIHKIFVGAILTATSVGITARVFKDLDFLKAEEARIVLGAAVIDDILGLLILAIVSGLAVSGVIEMESLVLLSTKAFGFLFLSLLAGILLARRTIKLLSYFKIPGMMLTSALVICFLGAYLANLAGLGTIVGAFAMGLILEDIHFKPFEAQHSIEDYLKPVSQFFVPVFFVLTGMKVDISVFADSKILLAALVISSVAIFGKLICAWSFVSKSKLDRVLIGIGMVPRGEVGLIFAMVGKSIGVVDDNLYAITVIMVILTTLIPPPILNFLIKKK
jgi:Kef-type K+ transport system membrane component KefB